MRGQSQNSHAGDIFLRAAIEGGLATHDPDMAKNAEQSGFIGKFLLPHVALARPSRLNALAAALELAAIFLVGWDCWNSLPQHLLQGWCSLMVGLVTFRFVLSEIRQYGYYPRLGSDANRRGPSPVDIAVNLGWAAVALLPPALGLSPALLVLLLAMVMMGRTLLETRPNSYQLMPFCLLSGLPVAALLLASGRFEAWTSAGALLVLCASARYLLQKRQAEAERYAAAAKDNREARQEAGNMAFRVAAAEETLQAMLGNISSGIAIYDKNMRFTHWNDSFTRLLDIRPEWMSTSRTILDIVSYHAEQGEYDNGDVEGAYLKCKYQFAQVLQAGRAEAELMRPNGTECHVLMVRLPGNRVMAVFTDISQGKKIAADALVHLSQHDSLTGLANRVKFRRDLEKAVVLAKRSGTMISVMMLNVDHFKDVNASLGQSAGDDILCAIARRLEACTRKTDVVARLGGDEFAIIGTSNKTADETVLMAKRFLRTVGKPIECNNKVVNIGASIGISILSNDTDGTDQIVRSAELALSRAKQEGRNNYHLYDSSLHLELQARAALERDIRSAMEAKEFAFHYQPQIDLKTKKVIGIEALMRWHHPERGWVPPDQFIPIAEATRLIMPLTETLLPDACWEIRKFQALGFDKLTVAINLSPLHFKTDGFLNFVSDTLASTGVDPECLEFEITEGIIMQDSDKVIETLTSLNQLGIKLSIDDFGTGYSSLSYLKKFPVDKLKIDKSFIRDVPHDKGAVAIVEAVIKLGHSFDLKVIAEGVETREQLDFLEARGCDEVQGYYYSKALPSDDLALWLEDRFIIEPSFKMVAG